MDGLGKGVQRVHSLRRLRLLIAITAVLFLAFVLFMSSLTENYLNNEFKQFNTIVITLVPLIFDEQWELWMRFFGSFATVEVTIPLMVLTFIWILLKMKDRILEISFLLIVVIGGEIFEEEIRRLFHHIQGFESPALTLVMKFFTLIGSFSSVFVIALFASLFLYYVLQHRMDAYLIWFCCYWKAPLLIRF